MMTKTKTKTKTTTAPRSDLSTFFARHSAILYAAKAFVERVWRAAQHTGEDPYVTTSQVVEHIAEHLPATYLKTFGKDEPKDLKEWRLKTILANAGYLGAYHTLGIQSTRGRGLTLAGRPRLRAIKGGRS